MKIFARKRLWLLAIPLLLASFGLWRVREARTWLPRATPLYAGLTGSKSVAQLPIVWRANGAWILRPDPDDASAKLAQSSAINWDKTPVQLHAPDSNPNVTMAVGARGVEVLKSGEKTLEFWRAGKKRYSTTADFDPPPALAISPDGTRWAIAPHFYSFSSPHEEKNSFSFDSVLLWDAQTKSQFARLDTELGSVTALEFSPDSQLLAAVAADGWAFVWDAKNGKLVRKWRAHPWVAATVAWSPDGKTLLTGANPRLGQAMNWTISIANGNSISAGRELGAYILEFGSRKLNLKTDAQGDLTINGQTDRSLRLWNVKSGQLLRKWESKTGIASAQFSPDGREIAVGTHGEALVFDAANLTVKRRLPMKDYPQWPASVAWAPDGKTLAVACAPQLTLWRAH